MALTIIRGNIFSSHCQTLVNTVNCVGVMGAGIALEFKYRYPSMYERYRELCSNEQLDIGMLWLYKSKQDDKFILNFPTKKHWKSPSKESYLKEGLSKFRETYEKKNITSIAFPVLGASKGGLPENVSLDIMKEYLEPCPINIEIYQYNPKAHDDFYLAFKNKLLNTDTESLKKRTGLGERAIETIRTAILNDDIYSISQLASLKGIGNASIEKTFTYLKSEEEEVEEPKQSSLFP